MHSMKDNRIRLRSDQIRRCGEHPQGRAEVWPCLFVAAMKQLENNVLFFSFTFLSPLLALLIHSLASLSLKFKFVQTQICFTGMNVITIILPKHQESMKQNNINITLVLIYINHM